jgi:hypothetical protein
MRGHKKWQDSVGSNANPIQCACEGIACTGNRLTIFIDAFTELSMRWA